ncbi:hypothetical protein PVAND_006852 [Polypedilum vanderplanki]|uniref:Uncharacterized protein n=1 Tax=Polypedilum vanderplanki TaxID=319348 RepID=A0A9J6C4G6_POLVA|nr:hypothetical protein PVAND_006852 [Polypedilum vanderplanki]
MKWMKNKRSVPFAGRQEIKSGSSSSSSTDAFFGYTLLIRKEREDFEKRDKPSYMHHHNRAFSVGSKAVRLKITALNRFSSISGGKRLFLAETLSL